MAESILEATSQQLRQAQAKITYLGPQTKPIPTVVFGTEGWEIAKDAFIKVQSRPYANDELPYTARFTVKPAEFNRILLAVKPLVLKEDVAKGGEFLSFAIVRQANGEYTGHEFRIGPLCGKQFYERIIGALEPENHLGRAALTKQFRNVLP
jgi:hypothetical protein